MKKYLVVLIALLFPLNVFGYSNYIIPGGNNIGIEIKNEGIIVIGFYKINNKYNINDLNIGDVIKKVNGNEVNTVDEMIKLIEENVEDNKINLSIDRNGELKDIKFKLINQDGTYKTGLYVKDSISGIGTLTYIDPQTKIYGSLGHQVIESASMRNVEVQSGTIFESLVTSIDRSTIGNAGTKNAKFYTNNIYGNVTKNTISGIYGTYTDTLPNTELVEVGKPEDLKLGTAYIYTVLEKNNIETFEINITNIKTDSKIQASLQETLKAKTS